MPLQCRAVAAAFFLFRAAAGVTLRGNGERSRRLRGRPDVLNPTEVSFSTSEPYPG
jgi:hypothetical protein